MRARVLPKNGGLGACNQGRWGVLSTTPKRSEVEFSKISFRFAFDLGGQIGGQICPPFRSVLRRSPRFSEENFTLALVPPPGLEPG